MKTLFLILMMCGVGLSFPSAWLTHMPVQPTNMPPIRIAGSNLTTSTYRTWEWQNGSLLYTNLVAWYDMYTNLGVGYNAGTNEVDFSPSNTPATVFIGTSSGATWVASSGPTSSYYSFDGGDCIAVPHIKLNSAFSFMMWWSSTNPVGICLATLKIGTKANALLALASTDYKEYTFGDGPGSSYAVLRFGTVYPVSKWEFVTITYNGLDLTQVTNYNCYINGSLITKVAMTHGWFYNNLVFSEIGHYKAPPNNDLYANGYIDDFRLYNTELSAQQVTNIFNATKSSHPNPAW